MHFGLAVAAAKRKHGRMAGKLLQRLAGRAVAMLGQLAQVLSPLAQNSQRPMVHGIRRAIRFDWRRNDLFLLGKQFPQNSSRQLVHLFLSFSGLLPESFLG